MLTASASSRWLAVGHVERDVDLPVGLGAVGGREGLVGRTASGLGRAAEDADGRGCGL